MIEQNLEQTGGELTDIPNEKYQKFFEKMRETLEIKDWKPVHLIGYFSQKYADLYETPYKFKFNSPSPSKCFEVFQIKKLSSILSSQPIFLKEYIDWVFEEKIIKPKKRITSISFLTKEETVKEYKFNVLMTNKTSATISRAAALPLNYRLLLIDLPMLIDTYGDLAFLAQMPTKTEQVAEAFNKLVQAGFDLNILSKIV